MTEMPDARFQLPVPDHVPGYMWAAVALEMARIQRAVSATDDGQVIGYAKCLVEAIAKVSLALHGSPVEGAPNYSRDLSAAQQLLVAQRSDGLTDDARANRIASLSFKMVSELNLIRNDVGSGHGRAAVPPMAPELADLVLETVFVWARWAMRRLDVLARSRPVVLVNALAGAIWRKGELTARLREANLVELPGSDQRMIGLAVGQRAANDTHNVILEGLIRAIDSPDLVDWPADYRLGVAHGLMFAADGRCTATGSSCVLAALVVEIVPDAQDELAALFRAVIDATPLGIPDTDITPVDPPLHVLQRLSTTENLPQAELRDLMRHIVSDAH